MKRTHDFIMDGERYTYDNGECSPSNDYAQMDTTQDAWYYGQWTNPFELKIVAYMEGDLYREEYESLEEYVDALKKLFTYDHMIAIDPMLNSKVKKRFVEIGLGHLLH